MENESKKLLEFIRFSSRSRKRNKNDDQDIESSNNKEETSFLKKILKKKSSQVKPNKFLEAGKKLPKKYEKKFLSTKLSGTPLNEIDEYYIRNEHTFIVINSSKQIYRFSSKKALFLLRPECVFRRLAIYLLTHSYPFFNLTNQSPLGSLIY